MLNSKAYWIIPNNDYGEIINVIYQTHIDMVFDNPERFDLTIDEIESVYNQYGEKFRVEGKARKQIILKLLEQGYIRIRLYPNKCWSISIGVWNDYAKTALKNWAKIEIDNQTDKYMTVKILTMDNEVLEFTVLEISNFTL